MATIDHGDTRRLLVIATTSGERFVIEEAAVYDTDGHCIGSRVIRASDAIYYGDLPGDLAAPEVQTLIRNWHLDNDVDEDDWFNEDGAWRVLAGN